MRIARAERRLVVLLTATALVSAPISAKERAGTDSVELVRRVTENEIAEADAPGHYMYLLRKKRSKHSETRQMIETADWRIGRLIMKNGRPLTSKEQGKEDDRLERLLTDPEALREEEEEQRKEEKRVRALFHALPDAFLYEQVAGTQSAESGQEIVKLRFRPNPSYDPPSRELRVLRGMEGTMLLDAAAERIVRVDARLLDHVDFGWGILGHVERGGTFLLVQRDVGSGRLAVETLAMHFRGKVLLLKPLRIDLMIETSDFRRMRDDLTLREGFSLLKQREQMRAGGGQESRTGGEPRTAQGDGGVQEAERR